MNVKIPTALIFGVWRMLLTFLLKSMPEMHRKIEENRYLLSVLRASVKRRDLYECMRKELDLICELPHLASKTWWSSTLVTIKSAFCEPKALNFVINGLDKLTEYGIFEAE